MFRSKKNIIVTLVAIITVVVLFSFSFMLMHNKSSKKLSKEVNIKEILERKSYSYLPKQAKNYIQKVYEETGNVLLTEKNKKENVSYLNPKFVEYLALSDEEKEKIDLIPQETIIDYVYNENETLSNEDLPAKFDLRNVDGKNFVTPNKDQGGLGLCWAFATNAQAESYLLVKNNESYEEGKSIIFSERQVDYATATDGINGYLSPYEKNLGIFNSSTLGTGGNFSMAVDPMKDAVSLTDNFKKYDDTDFKKMELYEVLNYANSKYEINSTVNIPLLNISELDLSKEEDNLKKDNYLSMVKEYIKTYGGAYVGTEAPQYSCSSRMPNNDNKYLIRVDENCNENANHAMQIIGWDDDLEYSYCSVNNEHYSADSLNCNEENTINGKGAWLLKNSWGNIAPFVYLAYDSLNSYIDIITDMSESANKEWNYGFMAKDGNPENVNLTIDGEKINYAIRPKVFSSEYVEEMEHDLIKIKFYASVIDSDYMIYYSESGKENEYDLVDTVKINTAGEHTINLSSRNLKIGKNSKMIILVRNSSGNLSLLNSNYNIYTKLTGDSEIKTGDIGYYKSTSSYKKGVGYEIYVYSKTKNINSNEKIDYKLFDKEGNDLSDKISYKYNYVATNNVNSLLSISDNIAKGEYILKTIYDNSVKCESVIKLSGENYVKTEDAIFINTITNRDNIDYELTVHSSTVNIASDELLDYELYDKEGNDLSDKISYINNDVQIYIDIKGAKTILTISADVPVGEYILKTKYNGEVKSESKIVLRPKKRIEGSGTQTEPYVITTVDELYTIYEKNDDEELKNNYPYFILGNDIDLTYDTQNEKGIFYNEGKGWIRGDEEFFSGSLDGNGHTIKGMHSSESLFLSLGDTNVIPPEPCSTEDLSENLDDKMTIIKNINFDNWTVDSGSIIAYQIGKVEINNISITNSKTENYLLFARNINNEYDDHEEFDNVIINNIFLGTNKCLGIIPSMYFGKISNVMSIGKKTFIDNGMIKEMLSQNASEIFGIGGILNSIFTNESVELNNIINTSDFIFDNEELKIKVKIASIIGKTNGNNTEKNKLQNIYYTQDKDVIGVFENEIPMDNVSKKTIKELTNPELYTNWEEFEENWKLETIDGIPRIPVLKFVDFEYTKIDDINLGLNESINIYDLITPSNELAKNITFEMKDNDVASVDDKGNITAFKYGKTTIHVLSNYDGYEKDVPILVKPTIVFDSNTGEGTMEKQMIDFSDGEILNKNTFTKEGYVFKEWNTKSDGSGTSYNDEQEIKDIISDNKEITLYAIWTPISYSVKFDPNTGIGTMDNQVFTYDSESTLNKNTFVKEGYVFKEWNTLSDGSGTSYSDEQEVINLTIVNEDVITLYAMWVPIGYEIAFNGNLAIGTMENQVFTYDSEDTLNKNTFVKEGYVFKEWNTLSDGSGTSYSDEQEVINLANINEEIITLYAIWTPINYSVRFDANTGIGTMDNQNFVYDKENTLSKNVFTKEGYLFKEWNTLSDGSGTSYSDEQEVINLANINEEIITLYAIWTPINYSVRFDANTGIGTMDNQVFAYDKENTLSKNVFTKEGYLFKEWNTLSDESGTSYSDEQKISNLTNITEEIITLYAIWTPISYGVKFDANTGIGTMENQVFTYDNESILNKNTFVKEGYVFKEWNTKADGKGTKYKDEANIINLTNKEETITLYAIWRLDTLFDIDDYVLKDEKYITKIPDLVDKKTYLEKIYTDSKYSVKIFKMDNTELSNDALIFTGSITKIMQNESVIAEFVNIVSGDVNEDGSISISDVAKVHSHVSKTNIMKEDYNLLAADVNASGDLTVSDTAKIFSYVKKTITDLRR